MMPMRSDRASASSIECVVSTIDRPGFAASMSDHICRFVSGSSPVVGSSRKTTAGLAIREIAKETRRFMPPDRRCTWRLSESVSSTERAARYASASHSDLGRPFNCA